MLIVERDKQMQMIRHYHVAADPCPACIACAREADEHVVHLRRREQVPSIRCARRDEINRRLRKDSLEAAEARWRRTVPLRLFGGDRPPLQGERAQPVQDLLVDAIEAAIAEDRDDVVRL